MLEHAHTLPKRAGLATACNKGPPNMHPRSSAGFPVLCISLHVVGGANLNDASLTLGSLMRPFMIHSNNKKWLALHPAKTRALCHDFSSAGFQGLKRNKCFWSTRLIGRVRQAPVVLSNPPHTKQVLSFK
jgi:hypothetical protein